MNIVCLCVCVYIYNHRIVYMATWCYFVFFLFSIDVCNQACCYCSVTRLCPTLCNPMDCNLSSSSVHGISQARILEWVAVSFSCREPARDIPLVTKVMRKGARHTQRWDRASGVPPDILEHLPPNNQSLPTLLLCALASDFTGGCPPPPSRSLCQRVNLQLQLIKFLGN